MKYASLFLAGALLFAASSQATILDPSSIDASRLLPPPPAAGSLLAKSELKELKAIAARSTPPMVAAASHDSKDEKPDLFNAALGFDLTTFPQTTALMNMVIDEENVDTKIAKRYFHRDRPWIVDPSIRTCTAKQPGPAANSYPSGHATLAFAMGVVLASLIPEKSQAILRRADEFGENRLVCGVHFRSDIAAGQQFGTVLALRLMQNPGFQDKMAASRSELQAGHIVH